MVVHSKQLPVSRASLGWMSRQRDHVNSKENLAQENRKFG
jgi:hypothetical protein